MKPDPTIALAMAASGYTVFPLLKYAKAPYVKDWQDVSAEAAYERTRQEVQATGWTLRLRATDPAPLVCLDVDAYDASMEEVCRAVYGSPDPPQGVGVVRSCSGGIHLYHRVPEGVNAAGFGNSFKLTEKVRGELRVSSPNHTALLVLPGTLAIPKGQEGKPQPYEVVSFPEDPDDLADLPDSTCVLLLERPSPEAPPPDKGAEPVNPVSKMPPPIHKLIEIVKRLEDGVILDGSGRRDLAYYMGYLCGRSTPRDLPRDEWMEAVAEAACPKFEQPWTLVQFSDNFIRGWSGGYKDADKWNRDTQERTPTGTDFYREAINVFGHRPWLRVHKDASGKIVSYEIGLGGSAKRPHEAVVTQHLDSVDSWAKTYAAFCKMGRVDMDTAALSQLRKAQPWGQVGLLALRMFSEEDRAGLSLEDNVKVQISQAALDAARAGHFGVLSAWPKQGKRRKDTAAWWWAPANAGAPRHLVLTPGYMSLIGQSAGIEVREAISKLAGRHSYQLSESKRQKEKRESLGQAAPTGTLYTIGLEHLSEEDAAAVLEQYRKRKKEETEK